MAEQEVFIPTENGAQLESRIISGDSNVAIVLTHPYALLGGNMDNNVVVKLYKHFAKQKITVCRFNFRGVGKSSGRGSWRGEAERQDVLSVCKYLLSLQSASGKSIEKITLVGYSYGSGIASSVVNELESIMGYVAISYPFGPFTFLYFGNWSLVEKAKTDKPSLFITGTQDNFTSITTFEKHYEKFEGKKHKVVHEDIDHFWFGAEHHLAASIQSWLDSILQ